MKDRIKRLSVLEEGKETQFWEALAGELDLSIKINEAKRDHALDSDDVKDPVKSFIDARDASKAIRAYRGVKLNVESAAEKIRSMNDKVRELTERIGELKTNKTQKASGGIA